MKVTQATIGRTTLLIETMRGEVDVLDSKRGRKTKTTGVKEDLVDAYEAVKDVISSIATDLGTQVDKMAQSIAPSSFEMEFALGYSAEAGLWVVTGRGEASLKVKFTWSPEKHD